MPQADPVIEAVKAELGTFGADITAKIEASNTKVKELDARMAELTGTVGDMAKRGYGQALADGTPITMRADETVPEAVDRIKRQFGVMTTRDIKRLPGIQAVRMAHAMMAAVAVGRTCTIENAIDVARGWDDKDTCGRLEESRDLMKNLTSGDRATREGAQRALGTQTLGSGAGFIKPATAQGIIDALIGNAVVRSMGTQKLPMPNGHLDMPFMQSSATAAYVGEGAGPNATQPVEGRMKLARKIIAAIVAMSKELVRESDYAVDAFLRQHLGRVFAAREDLALLRGDGTADTPRGIKWWAGQATTGGEAHVFNRTLDGGVPTVATITADVLKMMRLPRQAKVPKASPGFVFDVVTLYGLMAKRNATTETEIWPELRAGTFYGLPIMDSDQIPVDNAGDGAGNGTLNKGELYHAHFGHLLIGESAGLEINAFDGGAYKDPTGTMQSGITNREVVLQADQGHDFGATFRGFEATVLTSVDWGR